MYKRFFYLVSGSLGNPKAKGHLRMYLLVKAFLGCLTFAAFVMLPVWKHLLFSKAYFHHPAPVKNDYIAGGLLWLVIAFTIAAIFNTVRVLRPAKRSFVGCLIFSAILVFGPINEIRQVVAELIPGVISRSIWFRAIPAIVGIAILYNWKRVYRHLWRSVLVGTPFAAVIAFNIITGLATQGRQEQVDVSWRVDGSRQWMPNRVLWIIFDELDFRLAYSGRPQEVQLENFDRLKSQSYFFTNAVSPSRNTITSIPSLLDGVTYSMSAPISPSILRLRDKEGQPSSWGEAENVFKDSRKLGVRSGLGGWYFPYSRIFSNQVDRVLWQPYSAERFVGRNGSVLDTMRLQLLGTFPLVRQVLHSDTVQDASEMALSIINDQSLDFGFLHLPLPHLPGVVSGNIVGSAAKMLSDRNSYFSNLLEADKLLGKILAAVEASPRLDQTILIVSSDHPWRLSEIHDGVGDPRVPFLVRFPGQTNFVSVGDRFETVETRRIVRKIFMMKQTARSKDGESLLGAQRDQSLN